ncbi:heparinase II/III family protein [Roseococcus sp. DSY-14]|uniref:heparinase II/III domain-containing protein n=1 Tax=Roseococcus sp. DSY-14 TaxID=3369650 RepID=UPI00387B6B83
MRLRADVAWRLGWRPVALALAARRRRPALMDGADVRPLWEAHRWAAILHAPDPAAFARAWLRDHPPGPGPLWACGQEAALRWLHLRLACALRGAAPPPEVEDALRRRVRANPLYALAQDNNHPLSEAAALWAAGEPGARRRMERLVLRLVAPDGGFAQPSPAYQRLLLDVAAVAEWLARRRGDGLGPAALARLAAATRLLHALACPATGALPRIGHQDGSAFADLSGEGEATARASLERAARLFCGASAGWPGAPCLDLPLPAARLEPAEGAMGAFLLRRAGPWRAVLRGGAPRFRPNHADFLHLDLWDGPLNLLRDGGTGAYNPRGRPGLAGLDGTAAHNLAQFDGEEQMPRVGPFLHARWPRAGWLPDGGWMQDHRGRRHERRLALDAAGATVEDALSGPFRRAELRWRLPPGPWRLVPGGAEGPGHRILSDAPAVLEAGRESLRYGEATPCPVLRVALDRPGAHRTRITRR